MPSLRVAKTLTFLVSLLLALGLMYLTAQHWRPLVREAGRRNADPQDLLSPPPQPYLMVKSTRPDASFGKLLLVSVDVPDGPAYETSLSCDRVAFAEARGLCLVVEGQESPTHYAYVFNDRFERIHKIPLAGVPSRVRLAPNGRLGAISVWEHTYNDPLVDFVARTIIVDTTTGVTRDLRDFRYTQNSRRLRERNFGVWGVTFAADNNRFFATLEVKNTNYLLEGDLARGAARVLRAGMECPSLSPDNSKIVYKRRIRVDDDARLRVYDLSTGSDVAIEPEWRSIVDQVDWLDNERVMYHITGSRGSDVWSVRVDGGGGPKILRTYAYSPAVVR